MRQRNDDLESQDGQDQHHRTVAGLGDVEKCGRVDKADHRDEDDEHRNGDNEEYCQAGVQYLAELVMIPMRVGLGHAVDDIELGPHFGQ